MLTTPEVYWSFADAELQDAAEKARLAGMPPSVTPAQAARFLRLVTGQRTIGTTTVDLPQPSLEERKTIARKKLALLVGRLARVTGAPHSHIHADLNRHCGDKVATAALESIEKRLGVASNWIAEASA